jgi:hypothetical protein
MSLNKIVDWQIAKADGQMVGTIASPFYELYVDSENWVWACDVDIGQEEPLVGVAVSTNNREIIYAEIGKSVSLNKLSDGKYCISGLSKKCQGLGHVIYMTFEDDRADIVGEDWVGSVTRIFTLGELGDLGPGAFGALPLGVYGRFTPAGILTSILER